MAPKPGRPSQPESSDGFVAVGWVRGPHGIRGELRVSLLSDVPERFAPESRIWVAAAPYKVKSARPHRGGLLVALDGIRTRSQAERFRNLLLEVPDGDLAPLSDGQYYRFQIVGLAVFDVEGQTLGHVERVLDKGANDVYLVQDEESELLIPAIDSVVKEIDVAGGRMVVEPLAGLERRPLARPKQR